MFSFSFASLDFQMASKEELMQIKGIGTKKAQSIIDYRKTNKINSVDDLGNIKGFGPKLIQKIKESKYVKENLKKLESNIKDKAGQKLKF
jgi:competence protein ComEA